MDTLERIWELVTGFFTALGSGFERAVTSLFGSSNARYIKKLQPKVDAINACNRERRGIANGRGPGNIRGGQHGRRG